MSEENIDDILESLASKHSEKVFYRDVIEILSGIIDRVAYADRFYQLNNALIEEIVASCDKIKIDTAVTILEKIIKFKNENDAFYLIPYLKIDNKFKNVCKCLKLFKNIPIFSIINNYYNELQEGIAVDYKYENKKLNTVKRKIPDLVKIFKDHKELPKIIDNALKEASDSDIESSLIRAISEKNSENVYTLAYYSDLTKVHNLELKCDFLSYACLKGNASHVEMILNAWNIDLDIHPREKSPQVLDQMDTLPALHVAVLYGKEEIVDLLLKYKVRVDVTFQGANAIQYALMNKNSCKISIIKKLMDHKLDIKKKNENGESLLHYAFQNSTAEMIKFLIENGLQIDELDNNGKTPFDFMKPEIVEKMKSLELIRTIIDNGVPVDSICNSYEQTMLHLAAINNMEEMTKMLLGNGADPTKKDSYGRIPLHYAAYNDNQIVFLSLSNIAELYSEKDAKGLTPTHFSTAKSDKVLLSIIKNADLEVMDNLGQTPLFYAVKNKNLGAIKLLMNQGANIKAVNNEGVSLLMFAAKIYDIDLAIDLYNKGCDIKTITKTGNTILHFLAMSTEREKEETTRAVEKTGFTSWSRQPSSNHYHEQRFGIQPKVTKTGFTTTTRNTDTSYELYKIIKENAIDVNAINENGETALFTAAIHGNLTAFTSILELGADPSIRNKENQTILHAAIYGRNTSILSKVSNMALDPNAKATGGFTALHMAAKENASTIEKLFGLKIDLFAKTDDNQNVFHILATNSFNNSYSITSAVSYLSKVMRNEFNDYINAQDVNGNTPLHIAAMNNNTNMVKALKQFKAYRNIANNEGKTAEELNMKLFVDKSFHAAKF